MKNGHSDLIKRAYEPLSQYLAPNKVVVIYGPRRVGKTTLITKFLAESSLRKKVESGDNFRVQEVIGSSDFKKIKEFCSGYELIVFDEAQNIPQVGKGLKIIVDQIPGIQVIATGSSSFDLSNKIGEPLVGRQRILKLFPISLLELSYDLNRFELHNRLEEFMIYGLYPEVITKHNPDEKTQYLVDLVQSYLLKDILSLENIKSPRILLDLLRLLAFQIGNEVSLNELSNTLKVDIKTIARYLDLLEKSFIIFSLGGFSRNLRNEITSKRKYFFFDNGIRNAIINSFNPLAVRNDKGALWENFVIMERIKKKAYQFILSNDFFWRTYSKKEIDLIEEREGKLFGFEFKWQPKNYKVPLEWRNNYPDSEVIIISTENYLDFVL
jgi:predicted AAA+ superfamily ATPase